MLLSVILSVCRHFIVSQEGPTHENRSYILYLQPIVSGKAVLMSAPDIAALIQDAVGRAITDALAQRVGILSFPRPFQQTLGCQSGHIYLCSCSPSP